MLSEYPIDQHFCESLAQLIEDYAYETNITSSNPSPAPPPLVWTCPKQKQKKRADLDYELRFSEII
jgi:hypothetical protein